MIGDDLSIVASGPTVSPAGGAEAARAVLESATLWEKVPASVRTALEGAEAAATPETATHLIGSNRVSLEAMTDASAGAIIVDASLTGDVEDATESILSAAITVAGPQVLLFGGETTVRLTGNGRGGRNQELALRIALKAQALSRPWFMTLS